MLSLQIFNDSSMGRMLADFSRFPFSLSTNRHGFAMLRVPFIPMSLQSSFTVYGWPGLPHVVVSDGAAVVWEGRLEDIDIVAGGVALTAFGYQRALHDVPYTAAWSVTGVAGWKPITSDVASSITPDRYEMDNNNRIYIAPRKGETFSTGSHFGDMSYALPHSGLRNIAKFTADYSITLPSNWKVRIITSDYDYTNSVTETTVTATGSNQTGSFNLTTSSRQRVIMAVFNDSGVSYTVTGNTGEIFAKITNVRIKTTTATNVLASDIAAAMASYIGGINTDQLSTSSALVSATTTDLNDEIYEDKYPAEILDRLALIHSHQWSVWENRYLTFQDKTTARKEWLVDVTSTPELQRSLENIRNSAYGIYRDASGFTLRTNTVGDGESQSRYGVLRRGFISVQTTSLGEAQTHRSAWLADRADLQIRARIEFSRVYDEAGARWPLWAIRAGDTVTMRNLPPTLSTGLDRIRTFMVGETDYDAATGSIDIAPDDPIPTLVTLVAQQAGSPPLDAHLPRR
jgi:hypothetical protein